MSGRNFYEDKINKFMLVINLLYAKQRRREYKMLKGLDKLEKNRMYKKSIMNGEERLKEKIICSIW